MPRSWEVAAANRGTARVPCCRAWDHAYEGITCKGSPAALTSPGLLGVQIGDVVDGTVMSVKPYGAFVDIGNGVSGLLHISQISHDRIANVDKVGSFVL